MKKVNEFDVYMQIADLSELLTNSIVGLCKSARNKDISKPNAKIEIKKSIDCFIGCSFMLLDSIDNNNSKSLKKTILYISHELSVRATGIIDKVTFLSGSKFLSSLSNFGIQRAIMIPRIGNNTFSIFTKPKDMLMEDISNMKREKADV